MVLRVRYKEIIFAFAFTIILLKFFLYIESSKKLSNKKSSDLSLTLQVSTFGEMINSLWNVRANQVHFIMRDKCCKYCHRNRTDCWKRCGMFYPHIAIYMMPSYHTEPLQISSINQRNVTKELRAGASEQDLLNGKEAIPLSSLENDLLYRTPIDVALIFTKAVDNKVFQYNLRRATTSLLRNAHVPIRLHLIADEESFSVGLSIIKEIQEDNHLDSRHIKLVFVSASELADEVGPTVKILQEYFTNKSSSHYKDFLFFFSLFMDRLLPGINNIILMDIDIQVEGDIAELYSHFSRFSETQIMGLSPELSPVYRHILSTYRSKHPDTSHGSPLISKGFPGYNSGVMLINIPKLMDSSVIKSYLTRTTLEKKTKEYSFAGHHGDQDLYTLIAFDYPELFYLLPCAWNRQLCRYWNIELYRDVFDQYFECTEQPKIIHGNCKTPIPS